jgi:PEP-CTERM motif
MKRIIAVVLLGLLAHAGRAPADVVEFAATRSGQFGTLNLQTVAFTQSGNPGTGFEDLTRIAGGPLYAVDANSNLLTLNTSNGSTNSSVALGTGLAIAERSDGVMFGTNSTSLYTINTTTGASVLVGSLGISGSSFYDFKFDVSGDLYFMSNNGSSASLYSLNTTTGAASLIGSIGAAIGVLGYENGTLYGLTFGPASQELYTINTTTGAGALVGTVTGAPGTIYGLATMDSAVPEPSSVTLFALGLAGLLAHRRMARRRG